MRTAKNLRLDILQLNRVGSSANALKDELPEIHVLHHWIVHPGFQVTR
jgi:hypothetical protein